MAKYVLFSNVFRGDNLANVVSSAIISKNEELSSVNIDKQMHFLHHYIIIFNTVYFTIIKRIQNT